jgi:hypothetical protein
MHHAEGAPLGDIAREAYTPGRERHAPTGALTPESTPRLSSEHRRLLAFLILALAFQLAALSPSDPEAAAQAAVYRTMLQENQNVLAIACTPFDREPNIDIARMAEHWQDPQNTSAAPYPMRDFLGMATNGALHTDTVRYEEVTAPVTYKDMQATFTNPVEQCIDALPGDELPDEGLIALYMPVLKNGWDGSFLRHPVRDEETGEIREYGVITIANGYFVSTIPHELTHLVFSADHERDYRGNEYRTPWSPTGYGGAAYGGPMAAVMEMNGYLPADERLRVPYAGIADDESFRLESLFSPTDDPEAVRMVEIEGVPQEVVDRLLDIDPLPYRVTWSLIIEKRDRIPGTIDEYAPDSGYVVTLGAARETYRIPRYFQLYFPPPGGINPLTQAWQSRQKFAVPGDPAIAVDGAAPPELSLCFRGALSPGDNVALSIGKDCQVGSGAPYETSLPIVGR